MIILRIVIGLYGLMMSAWVSRLLRRVLWDAFRDAACPFGPRDWILASVGVLLVCVGVGMVVFAVII